MINRVLSLVSYFSIGYLLYKVYMESGPYTAIMIGLIFGFFIVYTVLNNKVNSTQNEILEIISGAKK